MISSLIFSQSENPISWGKGKIKAIWDVEKTRFSFHHLHWQFVRDSWESISYMYISEVNIISSAVKSVVAQQ